MSDLQTALFTALKEWEPPAEGTVIEAATPAPTPKPKPTPRPNLTRDTFAMVRDNPGISRANAIERLQAMGHKPVSTSSILYQLVRARMIDEVNGTFSTKRKNYTSLTNALEKAPKGRRKTRVQKPKVIEAAPEPQATPTPAPTPSPRRVSMNVDEWLDTVPLKTARQVYWKLHGIFGGQAI
jgi:hypothetical protein